MGALSRESFLVEIHKVKLSDNFEFNENFRVNLQKKIKKYVLRL